MLAIRHRTGPLKDQEQKFDDAVGELLFGRDAGVCNVVYPSEETAVSHRHFKLVREPNGDWTFDLFGRPYVAVNGRRAEPGRPVKHGDVIELGRPGGPSFTVTEIGQGLRQGPATDVQPTMPAAGDVARRARRLAVVGVCVAAIAVADVLGVTYLWRADAVVRG